jgi:hypothetical protein
MTVQIEPSPANPGGWVSMFPITAAWTAAWQEAGELWLGAMGQAGQAVVDLAKTQTDLVSKAMTLGVETAGASASVGGLAEACASAAVCGTEQVAEAAMHMVEDIGLGDREFVPLPE